MRAISEMEVIQIDITNACHRMCSNCTRFCGHHRQPFFMDMPTFHKAVDSLIDFPGMVGIMGGEPLLHPRFEEMARYLEQKIVPRQRRGLWSTIPAHRVARGSTIRDVFGHLNLNDHSVDHIMHQPVLVASAEVVPDARQRAALIDNCWVQMMWSASITPKGAFFCEVAAAMSHLFDGPEGWPVEPGWWKRKPEDFTSQRNEYCNRCGCAMPLPHRRSTEEVDDVSRGNLERLVQIGSPKLRKEKVQVYGGAWEKNWHPGPNWYMAKVKNEAGYRQSIGDRIGIKDVNATNVFGSRRRPGPRPPGRR